MKRWGCRVHFRCAHVPSGNGISERNHRSIKRIAARAKCSVPEAVYWYNVTPRDDTHQSSAPINCLHRYEVRVRGIDSVSEGQETKECRYAVGDRVWVRPPNNRCDMKYTLGEVTRIISEQSVEVGGTPRHVRDLRPARVPQSDQDELASDLGGEDQDSTCETFYPGLDGLDASVVDSSQNPVRRSPRDRVPTDRYGFGPLTDS